MEPEAVDSEPPKIEVGGLENTDVGCTSDFPNDHTPPLILMRPPVRSLMWWLRWSAPQHSSTGWIEPLFAQIDGNVDREQYELYATSGAGSTVEMFSVILAEDLLQKQADIMVIGTYVLDVTVTHHFIRSGFIVQLRGLDDHSLHPGITLGDIGGTFGSRAAWIMVSCALTMCATQKKKC